MILSKWLTKPMDDQQMVVFCEHLMKLGLKYITQSDLSLSRSEFDTSSYKTDLLKHVRSSVNKSWSKISNKHKLPMFWPIWHKIFRYCLW